MATIKIVLPINHSWIFASVKPRIKKLASVLPTKIVHRNFSGFSRKPFSNFADGLPARASRRTRSRFSANTPASMPDSKNDSSRHRIRTSQLKIPVSISFHSLHKQFAHAAFVHDLRGEFQIVKRRGIARVRHDAKHMREQSAHRLDFRDFAERGKFTAEIVQSHRAVHAPAAGRELFHHETFRLRF